MDYRLHTQTPSVQVSVDGSCETFGIQHVTGIFGQLSDYKIKDQHTMHKTTPMYQL
jgi:hypothetical protein